MIRVGSVVAVLGMQMIVHRLDYDDDGWLRHVGGTVIGAQTDAYRMFDPTETAMTVITVH